MGRKIIDMSNTLTAERTHRIPSNHQPSRILIKLLECLRLIILTITLATGITGIYLNPADSNVKEISLLVLKKAPQFLDSIKRLRRR
jgi:hypothetical protein